MTRRLGSMKYEYANNIATAATQKRPANAVSLGREYM
jgi:hypothetical protein